MSKRVTITLKNGDKTRKTIPDGYVQVTEGVLRNGDLLLDFAGYGPEWRHEYKWILVDSYVIEQLGALVSDQYYVIRKDKNFSTKENISIEILATIPEGYFRVSEGISKDGDMVWIPKINDWRNISKEEQNLSIQIWLCVIRKIEKSSKKTNVKSVPTKYDSLLELEKEVQEIIKERENSQKNNNNSNDNAIIQKMNVIVGQLDKIIQFLESIKYNTANK